MKFAFRALLIALLFGCLVQAADEEVDDVLPVVADWGKTVQNVELKFRLTIDEGELKGEVSMINHGKRKLLMYDFGSSHGLCFYHVDPIGKATRLTKEESSARNVLTDLEPGATVKLQSSFGLEKLGELKAPRIGVGVHFTDYETLKGFDVYSPLLTTKEVEAALRRLAK